MNPKVSVLLFFQKDRGWLDKARESVYNQDYDGEIELLRSDLLNPDYQNMNASQNLNFLIKKSTGKYIKYLCEDDELTPISISASVKAMQEQGCDFLHGNSINRFMTGLTFHDKLYSPRLTVPTIETIKKGNYVHGGTLFYKADLFKKDGFTFDETLDCAEEMDLTMNLLKNGKKMGYCQKYLYIYRRHEKQKSLGKEVDQQARAKRIQAIMDRY